MANKEEMRTIDVQVPISNFHEQMVDLLEGNGVDVGRRISNALQQSVEDSVHALYQQSRHSNTKSDKQG